MSSIFDIFSSNSSSTGTANADSNTVATSTNPTQTVSGSTITTSAPTIMSAGGGYNGIGSPSVGQSYNGIGSPPSSNVTDTTVETQVQNTIPQNPIQAPGQVTNQTIAPITNPTPNQQDPNLATNENNQAKTPEEMSKNDPNTAKKAIDPNISKREALDMMTHFTQRSNRVILSATNKAKELKSEFVDSEHLLWGLTSDAEIYKVLTNEKVPPQAVLEELQKSFKMGTVEVNPIFSPRLKRIMDRSLVTAKKLGYEFISPEHLLFALLEEGEGMGAVILAKLGVKKDSLQKKALGDTHNALGTNPSNDSSKTQKSALAQYTIDLTEKATKGQLDPVVERSEVIERVIHILSRRSKNNPALIGEAGVGKTAIVEGLAQKIVKREVPEVLLDKKVLQLDLMSIVAGASHRGEFEERMKNIIEEIRASAGKIILFVDEMHNMVGAGNSGEGSLDVANFIKPALARSEMQLIGATTTTEYNRYITKDPALERRFQPIIVPEPDAEAAIKMLKATRDKYEAFHRVTIPDSAIEAAVNLSKRYVGGRFLPDKAIDLIDEAASAVRLPLISLPEVILSTETRIKEREQEIEEARKSGNQVRVQVLSPKLEDLREDLKTKQEDFAKRKAQSTTSVGEEIIKQVISRWTGIPVMKISSNEIGKLNNLESIMHTRLIGQAGAVTSIAQAVRRGRAGLKNAKRPIGSFIFLGPTGVGKTELSKTLAEVLFGHEDSMIRFDMTEYMEKHEVAKLLGAPPGYVGYEEGGKLTEAVKRKPYAVVLFDEVEKAHPDIFNILLQILDDGRLTDNKGNTVSFKDAVVICTSNIGTATIQNELMSAGALDIEEPTPLSTFALTPRGRQIMTIMNKIFTKDSQGSAWISQNMVEYFAGMTLNLPKDETGKPLEVDKSKYVFPNTTWDTQAISGKGEELITVKDMLFMRNSTTGKTWDAKTLLEYFTDHTVINAMPDSPEEQLPTARLKTHAFSPAGLEIISLGDKYWKRGEGSTDWEVGSIKNYFGESKLVSSSDKGTPPATDSKKEEKDVSKTQDPNEIPKIDDTKSNVAKSEEVTPNTNSSESPITLPTQYWDIHTFSPNGDEHILCGEDIFIKKTNTNTWETKKLTNFFGSDFPLETEITDKKKIENEIMSTQYDRIKSKVLEELKKFFRPELINRFDEVIIFEPLSYTDMGKIAQLQMKSLKTLMEDQSFGLKWTTSALKYIVHEGFDPIYGARPLRRAIQRLVENPISSLIIDGSVKEGDSVKIDSDTTSLSFVVERAAMVEVSALTDAKPKHMYCNLCGSNFETIIVKNATAICAICASIDVALVEGEKIEPSAKIDDEKSDQPSDKSNLLDSTEDTKDDKDTSPKNTEIDKETPQSISQANQVTQSNSISSTSSAPQAPVAPESTKTTNSMNYPVNLPPTPPAVEQIPMNVQALNA